MEQAGSIAARPNDVFKSPMVNSEESELQEPSLSREHRRPIDYNTTTADLPAAANCDESTTLSGAQPRTHLNTTSRDPSKALGVGETPHSISASQSSGSHQTQLEREREGIAEEHRYVPCMSLQQFRHYLLPRSVSDENIKAIIDALDVESLKLLILEARGQTRVVSENNSTEREGDAIKQGDSAKRSKKKGKKEAEFFKHIATIYDQVASAGRKVLGRQEISMINYFPKKAPSSLGCDNTSVPDCNLVLATSTSCNDDANVTNVYYCDVFVTCEFEKEDSDSDICNNHTKLIWYLRHIMREDPCRRFAFGITVENTSMRIWQANRADIFVSDAFDYVEDLEELLAVLAQLIFAKKAELGWDESIHRIAPNTYKIRVGTEWYITEKMLSNHAAGVLTGHASRVWLATVFEEQCNTTKEEQDFASQNVANEAEKGNNEKKAEKVVIKESWPGLDSMPEDEVQALLLSEASKKGYDELKEYLFTISSHERVKIDGEEDSTIDTILRGLDVDNLERLSIQHPTNDDGQVGLSEASTVSHLSAASAPSASNQGHYHRQIPLIPVLPKPPPSVRHRYHYRMVMQEVGQPVWQLDDLEEAFTAYRDALIVVGILSACGWVHRDISSGNVYYYNGRGIVGDFEYAKRIDSGVGCETRAGTRNFMALEVALRQYQFRARMLDLPKTDGLRSSMAKAKAQMTYERSMPVMAERTSHERSAPKGKTGRHFFHNPLHDVESVWWGCVELLFKKRIECTALPQLQQEYKNKFADLTNAISGIFPDGPPGGERIGFLRGSENHEALMSSLPPALNKLGQFLSINRATLVSYYGTAEQTDDWTICKGAYGPDEIGRFVDLLTATIPLTRGMKLKDFSLEWAQQTFPMRTIKPKQRAGSKRKCSEPSSYSRVAKKPHIHSKSDA